ncbi:hypothetical protein EJB05_15873, partial [Eragrostis curvula]
MGGGGGRVKVVGQVERVDGRSLTYAEFVDRFMAPNRPVEWTLPGPGDRRRPNLGFFARNFPSPLVPVADCSSREFTDQKRLEMSMQEFVDHWAWNSEDHDGSLLYLKDWHFVKEYPDYVAYTTPTFFVDDWLKMYLDSHPIHRDSDIANHKNEVNCTDYLFVYMGTKGTWTPLHADVFRSYSWSANVSGRKLWLFLSPSQNHRIFDRNMRSSVYNINDDVSEKQFPEFNKNEWLECIQKQNEIIFVPSGWYHQVHNLEDTISINHNWFNAYNLHWVTTKLQKNILKTFEIYVMIFRGFVNATLQPIQKEDAAIPAEIAHHFVFNLTSIRNVASKMISTDAFSTGNLLHISEDNRGAFSNIKQILEEDSFRRLLTSLSKAYKNLDSEQRTCLKTRVSTQEGCLSVSCLKSDCSVVDEISNFTCEVRGPEDLVRLIDNVLS